MPFPITPPPGTHPKVSTTPRSAATGPKLVAKPPWTPRFQVLEDVESKETRFLWKPYVPFGAVTLLFGHGGMGKSWITCNLAAALSAGRPLPGSTVALPPQKILMVSAEDDPGRIIKPRMAAMQANMHNILVSDDPFILDAKGVVGLEIAMRSVNATILFLDPLVSYLGGVMDINKSNEARAMMGPLGLAAAKTGCAVVVVHHANKGSKQRAADKAIGSVDFINSVRSAMYVDENQDGKRFMAHVKHNWSEKGPTLTFNMDGSTFNWGGEISDREATGVSKTPMALQRAQEMIFEQLRDGPKPSTVILAEAEKLGFPVRTLERAKKGIAHSVKQNGVWLWELDTREGFGDVVANAGNVGGDQVPRRTGQEPVRERVVAGPPAPPPTGTVRPVAREENPADIAPKPARNPFSNLDKALAEAKARMAAKEVHNA